MLYFICLNVWVKICRYLGKKIPNKSLTCFLFFCIFFGNAEKRNSRLLLENANLRLQEGTIVCQGLHRQKVFCKSSYYYVEKCLLKNPLYTCKVICLRTHFTLVILNIFCNGLPLFLERSSAYAF